MAQNETTSECAGCGKELNLLLNHLVVNQKVRKLAFVQIAPDPESFDPEESKGVEEEDENTTVLGARTGVGEELLFHDFNCVALYFDEHKEDEVELRLNQDDSDPYNAGGEEE